MRRDKDMKWRVKLTITLLIVLLRPSLGSDMALPHLIDVDNKPSVRIEIVPIDDAHRSHIPVSLREISSMPPGAFILVNHTATPITAVVARWTYTDSRGSFQQHRLNCDAYVFAPLDPIVDANDLSLVTPYGCARQEFFPQLASGSLIGSALHPSSQRPILVDPHATMHLYVDLVLFQDGQIWGPDKFDYSSEISARYATVQEFVLEVTSARHAGEDMASVLTRIRGDSSKKTEKNSSRRGYYAGLLQRSPNPEGTLAQLQSQVPPPAFRHISEEQQ